MELGKALRVVEYAEGWRVWCVQETASGLRLASVVHDAAWPRGTDLVALCDLVEHVAPDVECTCGIHAAREPAPLWTYLHGRDEPATVARVLGQVALWGRVVEHEHGWRAERAFPLSFVTGDPLLQRRLSSLVDAHRVCGGYARQRRRIRGGRPRARA
jgi:hypothetical protein